jgi:formate dehydrogenase major subunit
MMDEAAAGRLKAMWIIGYDVLPTLANVTATRRALSKLEFVVVQDLFITETAEAAADIFLPAASVFEKDGTFMNAERRVQRVRKAIEPPGEARTDWQIICALAERMGHGSRFRYDSPEEIWNEIRQVWPEAAGMTYGRIAQEGLQWPCRSETDPGTTILHASRFGQSARATLRRIEFHPSPEQISQEFPLLLSTGRSLYQFNSGTMTMRTKNKKLRPTDVLDICEVDAERLRVKNGDLVRVSSRYGSAQLKAHVTNAVGPGELFATFHDKRVNLNRVTGPFRDNVVQSPEYKVTAVCVTPLS